jgi:hypothetical protein
MMTKYYDLAIRWNDNRSSFNQLKDTGKVAVWGRPQYFRPGGQVAIVTGGNIIKLLFKASAVEGPKRLKLANGKMRENSYLIRADKRSIQEPDGIPSPIKRWRAIGQFRYFDAAKAKAIQIERKTSSTGKYIDNHIQEISGTRFKPHTYGIPGKPRNHPEAQLVEQYVQWMGGKERFGHNYIPASHLYVDLFDKTYWQLIEAKASTNREILRMALGQLRDYNRYYKRRLTLVVLLPSRPSAGCVKLLTDNHIAVIWRNPGGSFSTKRWQDG